MLDKKSIESCEKIIENIIKTNKIETALGIIVMKMREYLSILKHTNPIDNVEYLMKIANEYEKMQYVFNRLWKI